MSGTARTMPSAPPSMLKKPVPCASPSIAGSGTIAPRKSGRLSSDRRARDRDACLEHGTRCVRLARQDITRDGRRILECLPQQHVVIGQRGHVVEAALGAGIGAQDLHDARGRRAIRFGEQDVIRDGRRTRIGQHLRQPRDVRARPRPLPQFRERRVVDVDDFDGSRLIRPRRRALISVEDEIAHLDREIEIAKLDDEQKCGDEKSGNDGERNFPANWGGRNSRASHRFRLVWMPARSYFAPPTSNQALPARLSSAQGIAVSGVRH